MAGQIEVGSPLGLHLSALAADSSVGVIWDVGTWSGFGTTLCLQMGMAVRKTPTELFTIEANRERCAVARENWRLFQETFHKKGVSSLSAYADLAKLLTKQKKKSVPATKHMYGRVADRMMSDGEILSHPLFLNIKEHWKLYGADEKADFEAAPKLVLPSPDLVVLDGGEFSGYYDWVVVKELNPRFIAMDDTRLMKNSRALQEALVAGWRIVASGEDRCGWAILEHKPVERLQENLDSK
jgi:hypothetical protein